ncbi:MAG: hypothetical protein ACO28R_09595, partial [Vulcanococcus sp.]
DNNLVIPEDKLPKPVVVQQQQQETTYTYVCGNTGLGLYYEGPSMNGTTNISLSPRFTSSSQATASCAGKTVNYSSTDNTSAIGV